MYFTLTRRLANNFGSASSLKMVDVSGYLPFEEGSKLARVEPDFGFGPEDDLPVLDGAAALVPVYASVIENLYPEGCVTYEGGAFSDDNKYGENFAPDSAMQYHNTIRGFNALVDGDVDIFFTAHPSADQLSYADEKGVELEIVPIGLEAFVFFVNAKNPVEGLTSEQVRSIYRGEIKNWRQVGGPDKMINPLTRVAGSGSQTMMDRFMGTADPVKRHPLSVLGGSIGYSFRYYLTGMVGDEKVKMLALDGIYPDEESIRNGTYPLTAQFYAVYRKDNAGPEVKQVVEWLLSKEGQTMIEECGYVGLIDREYDF
ncbi:MAG: substrate-binding domain-containing protein [Lachnospiraceae bacterium]|nr:substrate-binding domain-containing protein [Lachnospiraceae bacterium]